MVIPYDIFIKYFIKLITQILWSTHFEAINYQKYYWKIHYTNSEWSRTWLHLNNLQAYNKTSYSNGSLYILFYITNIF